MGVTGLRAFDQSLGITKEWFKDIGNELGIDNEENAYRAFRAVSHALRNRILPQESADLSAQLPILLRGVFYESWKPSKAPQKIRSKEEFLNAVSEKLPDTIDPQKATKAVFHAYKMHVNQGEIRDVLDELPESLKLLWN